MLRMIRGQEKVVNKEITLSSTQEDYDYIKQQLFERETVGR